MLWWLILASVIVFLTPLVPGIWYLAGNGPGPPPESRVLGTSRRRGLTK